MPDYTVAVQTQVPQGLQTLGNIVNMAQGATNLQRSRATLGADIARAQAESQTAQANANVAQQTQQPRIATAQQLARQAEITANTNQFKLDAEQMGKAQQFGGAYVQDPRMNDPNGIIDIATELRGHLESIGVPKKSAEFWTSQIASKAHDPQAAKQLIANMVRAGAGSGQQAGVINAPVTPVQTPAGAIALLQLQPGAPGAVSPVPISSLQDGQGGQGAPGVIPPGVPPSQAQKLTVDALGRPAIEVTSQSGQKSYQPPPGAPYQPVMSFPPGENTSTMPENLAIRKAANDLGTAAPNQHFNNKMILDLSSDAFTGTGAGKIANVLNAIGVKNLSPDFATNPAAAQSQLKHFIARQIEENASAQGANTDAARSLAASAVLPSDSPEKAIKAITKINDAFVTGNELYNKGMEAAINSQSNQFGPYAARQFRNQWAQSFDPRIMLLENAQKSGDKEIVNRVLGDPNSPQGKAVRKDLLQKVLKLQALSQGQM
jgi:hypothetical protein